jgi:predicted GNAT family acetyltransferase
MVEDILNSRYTKCLKALDIYENTSSLILSKIIIEEECRGEGVGTKIMTDLIQYADANKQIVTLTPSSDFGGNKNRLTQFYKRFGFKANKGQYKSYEFRDTMIRYPKGTMNEDKLKGGKADKMSVKDIAKKFNVTVAKINKEIEMGIKIEREHTNSNKLAKEISMDHLSEIPDYYTRLKKMEKEGEKHWKKRTKKVDESIKDYITDLVKINLRD